MSRQTRVIPHKRMYKHFRSLNLDFPQTDEFLLEVMVETADVESQLVSNAPGAICRGALRCDLSEVWWREAYERVVGSSNTAKSLDKVRGYKEFRNVLD